MAPAALIRDSLRTGRAFVWVGMAAIVAAGWLYMVRMNAGMSAMEAMDGMAMPAAGGLDALGLAFLMWVLMMSAMMLPSAASTVGVFMTMAGQRGAPSPGRHAAVFVAGYLVVWAAYCVPAALAQWALSRAAVLTPMGESTSIAISATILFAAGLFQFSGLKDACITKCRSPFTFLMTEWRDGPAGALILGLRHGGYCVACCWALMAVMFVVGTMSLIWMGLLTLAVLAEKIAPARWKLDRVIGLGLVAWALTLAAGGVV